MKSENYCEHEIIGAIVLGAKPWNEDYNVGLVVEQAKKNVASFRIMWMRHKDSTVDRFLDIPSINISVKDNIVYTWEHPTSIDIVSRMKSHG